MALTYGFYDSVNGDRKYNAFQMSSLFDGLIRDGVFATVGNAFAVSVQSGLTVLVDTGRAWFDHTWTYNNAKYALTLEAADTLRNRIDAVVLEVDSSTAVRANSLKVVKGSPSTNPVRPSLTKTGSVRQYALAYISVNAGVTALTRADISYVVGTGDTPFVTGVLETVSVDAVVAQWNAAFDEWFTNVQAQLSGDVATNLQQQITELQNRKTIPSANGRPRFYVYPEKTSVVATGPSLYYGEQRALDSKFDELAELPSSLYVDAHIMYACINKVAYKLDPTNHTVTVLKDFSTELPGAMDQLLAVDESYIYAAKHIQTGNNAYGSLIKYNHYGDEISKVTGASGDWAVNHDAGFSNAGSTNESLFAPKNNSYGYSTLEEYMGSRWQTKDFLVIKRHSYYSNTNNCYYIYCSVIRKDTLAFVETNKNIGYCDGGAGTGDAVAYSKNTIFLAAVYPNFPDYDSIRALLLTNSAVTVKKDDILKFDGKTYGLESANVNYRVCFGWRNDIVIYAEKLGGTLTGYFYCKADEVVNGVLTAKYFSEGTMYIQSRMEAIRWYDPTNDKYSFKGAEYPLRTQNVLGGPSYEVPEGLVIPAFFAADGHYWFAKNGAYYLANQTKNVYSMQYMELDETTTV